MSAIWLGKEVKWTCEKKRDQERLVAWTCEKLNERMKQLADELNNVSPEHFGELMQELEAMNTPLERAKREARRGDLQSLRHLVSDALKDPELSQFIFRPRPGKGNRTPRAKKSTRETAMWATRETRAIWEKYFGTKYRKREDQPTAEECVATWLLDDDSSEAEKEEFALKIENWMKGHGPKKKKQIAAP